MGVKVRQRGSDYWIFVDHKGLRKAKKIGPNKQLAEMTADIVRGDLVRGRPLFEEGSRAPLPTVKGYYGKFEQSYMKTALKPTTRKSYQTSFQVHILPSKLANLRLDQVTKSEMADFVSELVAKRVCCQKETKDSGKRRKLSKSTIRLILGALSVLFEDAIERGLIEANPARGLGKYYRQAPTRHKRIEPLTEAEAVKFLRQARESLPQDKYVLLLLALHTGARSGEQAGLQWGDIDWEGRFWQVRRQVVRGRVSDLKTENGYRRVDLSDGLLRELQLLRARRHEQRLGRGSNEIPKWVFCNREGGFLEMYNFKRRHFKTVLRKAGLRSFRYHDLRHTFGSMLLAQGEPVTYVSSQLGHANPQITLRIYAHWIPNGSQRRAVNQLPTIHSKTTPDAVADQAHT